MAQENWLKYKLLKLLELLPDEDDVTLVDVPLEGEMLQGSIFALRYLL